jgi:predicted transposase/invertase (TIGR01784 family)
LELLPTIKLITENEDRAIITARELIDRTQQEINIEPQRQKLLELIETILVYKFPTMSRREIESMFGLSDLKQTQVYQEGKQEGIEEGKQEGRLEAKLEAVPGLLALGLTAVQISQVLDLEIELVMQVAQRTKNQDNESKGD